MYIIAWIYITERTSKKMKTATTADDKSTGIAYTSLRQAL